MIILFDCIALIFGALAAYEHNNKRVWRELYMHEQQLRNETQQKLFASDDLLGDYAKAIEKRDAVLLIAQRRLNSARGSLIHTEQQFTAAQ